MRTSNLFRVLTPLVLTVSLTAACSSGDDGASESSSGSDTSVDGGTSGDRSNSGAIVIDGFEFALPASVKAGATVEVRNEDGSDHTVTSDDDLFDTDTIEGDGSASFVAPSEPGTYEFHCDIHPSMKATLVVT